MAVEAEFAKIRAEGTIRVKFTNVEDPNPHGETKVVWPCLPQGKLYLLKTGQEYDLPPSLVDHLNSLEVPKPAQYKDPVTGELKWVEPVPVQPRFSVAMIKLSKAA
jgi:hypothetical protein